MRLRACTLLLRRVRPIFEATAYKYFGVRLMPDFGDGKVVLYDAYVDAKPNADNRTPKEVPAPRKSPSEVGC